MPFIHSTAVRFCHVDAAGIAYFSRAFELCHEAMEEVLTQGGLPLATILGSRDWAMPLVHAEADYKRPLRLGDHLNIEVRIERAGPSSLTWHYRVLGEGGDLRAEVRLVHSCIERPSFKPRARPAELDAALARAGLALPGAGEAR